MDILDFKKKFFYLLLKLHVGCSRGQFLLSVQQYFSAYLIHVEINWFCAKPKPFSLLCHLLCSISIPNVPTLHIYYRELWDSNLGEGTKYTCRLEEFKLCIHRRTHQAQQRSKKIFLSWLSNALFFNSLLALPSGMSSCFYLQQSFGKTLNSPSHAAFALSNSLRVLILGRFYYYLKKKCVQPGKEKVAKGCKQCNHKRHLCSEWYIKFSI